MEISEATQSQQSGALKWAENAAWDDGMVCFESFFGTSKRHRSGPAVLLRRESGAGQVFLVETQP